MSVSLAACKDSSDAHKTTSDPPSSLSESSAEVSGAGDFESSTADDPEKTVPASSEEPDSVPESSDTAHGDIVSVKTADGSIEHALKEILLRAATLEELARELENSVFADRVKGVHAQEYYKGPDVSAGEIRDGMVIFVDYDEDRWVRYVKSQLFDSSEITIWDGGAFDSALYYILLRAESIESLYRELKAFDVNERIDYVRIYKNRSDCEKGIYITAAEGELERGMVICIAYDSKSSSMEFDVF